MKSWQLWRKKPFTTFTYKGYFKYSLSMKGSKVDIVNSNLIPVSVDFTEKQFYRKKSVITENFLFFIGCNFYRNLFFCNCRKFSVKVFFCGKYRKNSVKVL